MPNFANPSGLRLKLALAGALLTLATIAVLGSVAEHFAAHALRTSINSGIAAKAAQMADKLDRGMSQRVRDIRILATLDAFRQPEGQEAERRSLLETVQDTYPLYAWIGVTDPAGTVVASTKNVLRGADVSKRPWFLGGRDDLFVGDVHEAVLLAKILARSPNEVIRFVDVATPLVSPDGTFIGVLGAHLSWEWARELEESLLAPEDRRNGVEIMIADMQGNVLLGPQNLLGEPLPLPRDLNDLWPDGRRYVAAMAQSSGYRDFTGLGWTVLVRQPVSLALAPVDALRTRILLCGLVLLAMVLAISWMYASRITAPLRHLTAKAQAIRTGRETGGIPILEGYREAAVLSRAISELLQRNAEELQRSEALAVTLETRVEKRTAELARANETLSAEIAERQRAEELREALIERLAAISITDELTGVHNRRGFMQLAERELQRSLRTSAGLWCVMLDIDHFKRVNDTYGHAAGDLVLRAVGQCCRQHLREIDVLGRFGGEEFAIMLVDSDQAKAMAVAHRLRMAIAELGVPTAKGILKITASFGTAPIDPALADIEEGLRRADAALYEAKHAGRNCVKIYASSAA